MKTLFIRLLSYPNACKVIDFINNNDKNDYANIVGGGVKMEISEPHIDKIVSFLDSLDVRYEIGNESPDIVTDKIKLKLKYII